MRGTAFTKSTLVLTLAATLWLIAIASGFAVLHRYESTPAPGGMPAANWPSETPLVLEMGKLTLVLAVHPRCPCTEATVMEVKNLLEAGAGRGTLNVLVFKPVIAADSWASSRTVQALAALVDAKIWTDEEGELAAHFGAETSGTLLVFNPQGELLFAGGVTPVRGQVGPNGGISAVAAFLGGRVASTNTSPVFGCSLVSAPDGRGGVR
ncbi:hypothetical protein BH10PLA2_BH10PLA2_16280 [soil metagenome]